MHDQSWCLTSPINHISSKRVQLLAHLLYTPSPGLRHPAGLSGAVECTMSELPVYICIFPGYMTRHYIVCDKNTLDIHIKIKCTKLIQTQKHRIQYIHKLISYTHFRHLFIHMIYLYSYTV